MRALLASSEPRARLAICLYVDRIRRELGSLVAAPGELADIMHVGFACAGLATRYARGITGGTIYSGGGARIVGCAISQPFPLFA